MYHSDKTYIFYTAVLTVTVWAEEDSSDFSKGHCAGETEKYCALSLFLLFTFKFVQIHFQIEQLNIGSAFWAENRVESEITI